MRASRSAHARSIVRALCVILRVREKTCPKKCKCIRKENLRAFICCRAACRRFENVLGEKKKAFLSFFNKPRFSHLLFDRTGSIPTRKVHVWQFDNVIQEPAVYVEKHDAQSTIIFATNAIHQMRSLHVCASVPPSRRNSLSISDGRACRSFFALLAIVCNESTAKRIWGISRFAKLINAPPKGPPLDPYKVLNIPSDSQNYSRLQAN